MNDGLRILFDECVKDAIELGRRYSDYPAELEDIPTTQEWDLALILFKQRLEQS